MALGIFEQLAWLTKKVKQLCCIVEKGGTGSSYKVYRAILFQDGTNSAPTAYVLENTLGITPTWEYSSIGVYNADFGLGVLDPTKVHGLCTLDPNSAAYWAWVGVNGDPPSASNEITLLVYVAEPSIGPSELGGYISVEIKVYP